MTTRNFLVQFVFKLHPKFRWGGLKAFSLVADLLLETCLIRFVSVINYVLALLGLDGHAFYNGSFTG